jgi:protein tyrosine phosphatase (PTP) superfamily phosphohydrolase (DUF442 family)
MLHLYYQTRLSMTKAQLFSISAAILISLMQPVTAAAPKSEIPGLPNFDTVAPGLLLRGGQPSEAGLAALSKQGVKTIIDLRSDKTLIGMESGEAKDLNLNFYSLPMTGTRSPSKTMIRRFLGIVSDPATQPVFVHCEEGVDRTGLMVAIYRMETAHWTADKAYREMLKHGFHVRYVWLTDALFDWAESQGASTKGRPVPVKLMDWLESPFRLFRV